MIFMYLKQLIFRVKNKKKPFMTKSLIILMGYIFTIGIFYLSNWSDFDIALKNPMPTLMMDVHTPISSKYSLSIIILGGIGVLGYCCIEKKGLYLPPLMSVIMLGSVWIGIVLSIMFIIHTSNYSWIGSISRYMLILYPVNYIIYSVKLMKDYIKKYIDQLQVQGICYNNPFLKRLSNVLLKSSNWLPVTLVITLPILVVVISILTLFGQRPDAIILAFTQTSDWVFSKMNSPQPIYYGGHYLCTASMGGHYCIVKPIRYGERRGERIIVNRQLLIANAFEQLLEERTPKIHYVIRTIYDKYGYPIAKYMTTPLRCDLIYILMKPLEYLFLICLYLFDLKPENRISKQYLSAKALDKVKRFDDEYYNRL